MEDGPSAWDLTPTWESQKKLLVPGFGLVQLHQLWLFREMNQQTEDPCPFLPHPLHNFKINKSKRILSACLGCIPGPTVDSIFLPVQALEIRGDGSFSWKSTTHVGDLGWVWVLSSASSVASMQEVNYWMRVLLLKIYKFKNEFISPNAHNIQGWINQSQELRIHSGSPSWVGWQGPNSSSHQLLPTQGH